MIDPLTMLFMFAGGIALFLLGMKMLTDGLKIAVGNTLRNLLAKYTSTMTKGILAGVLITAMVQSSSAVIFATIGFVNAGLMSLLQAIYVIFGSNVGTTLTGWIIATVGFKLNLQLLSMPILAVGMGLWLIYGTTKIGALGQALVGFSLFFLGIDILKNTFEGLGGAIPFDNIGSGISATLILLLIGILLTSMMQSSSATIAVIITAVAGGLIPVYAGAVMVIGADIGTTSTALMAVIGATSNAKRAAMAHVLFNVLKVPIALPFVGAYISLIYFVFGNDISVAVVIAIFHTMIKLAGLIVLLPFTKYLATFLEGRFTHQDVPPETTRYLDDNTISTPSIAVSALIFELKRTGRKTRKLIKQSIDDKSSLAEIKKHAAQIDELAFKIGDYIQRMQRTGFPHDLEAILPEALRVLQYQAEARLHAVEAAGFRRKMTLPPDVEISVKTLEDLLISFLRISDSERKGFSIKKIRKLRKQLEATYETVKSNVLNAGSKGAVPLGQMVEMHEMIRGYRRIWDQLFKSATFMDHFNEVLDHEPGVGPELSEVEMDHIEPNTAVAIQK